MFIYFSMDFLKWPCLVSISNYSPKYSSYVCFGFGCWIAKELYISHRVFSNFNETVIPKINEMLSFDSVNHTIWQLHLLAI